MNIFTGHTNTNHVTAELYRLFLTTLYGTGSYILPVWDNFAHVVETNNSFVIKRGMMVHHGNLSCVESKIGDKVTLTNGVQGMKRIDYIVNRYKKEELTGIESNEWVHIPGTPHATNPAAPSYNTGNVLNGALIDDCPVFKLELDGLNITKVTKILPVHGRMQRQITSGAAAPTGGQDGDVYIQFES